MKKECFNEEATLCYLVDDGRVLLIEKKRGLGAGKYNAPGGKLEFQETPTEAVEREVKEETNIELSDPERIGSVRFVVDGSREMYIHVFTATGYEGRVEESEEAKPEWHDVDRIPYDEMWEDNEEWVPHALAGNPFQATVEFSDQMELESYEVTTHCERP